MTSLSRLRVVLHCGRLVFAWLCALIMLCFVSLMSWPYLIWLIGTLGVVTLYAFPPRVFCRSYSLKRMALGLYCGAILAFVSASFWAVSVSGTGPLLLWGVYAFGSSRVWEVGVFLFMALCSLSGPVELLLHSPGKSEASGE
jgi:hypothetical protein